MNKKRRARRERETTIKVGAKIERENLKEQEEFINDKIMNAEFDENYSGIGIKSKLEGMCIGTEAHVFIDKEELKIRLKNSRTNETTIFSINDVYYIDGLFNEEEGHQPKMLWKNQEI